MPDPNAQVPFPTIDDGQTIIQVEIPPISIDNSNLPGLPPLPSPIEDSPDIGDSPYAMYGTGGGASGFVWPNAFPNGAAEPLAPTGGHGAAYGYFPGASGSFSPGGGWSRYPVDMPPVYMLSREGAEYGHEWGETIGLLLEMTAEAPLDEDTPTPAIDFGAVEQFGAAGAAFGALFDFNLWMRPPPEGELVPGVVDAKH
jgi:hypothetical protein